MTIEERARLGLRIRDARIQHGMRLEVLAEEIGVTRSYLANLERARRAPSLETLVSIARRLDVSLDYLVLGVRHEEESRSITLRSDDELTERYVKIIEAILQESKDARGDAEGSGQEEAEGE